MKNKTTTYVLLVAVILIWGMIGYRIFSAISAGDDTADIAPMVAPKERFDDYDVAKDTSKLLLNYRDPFGVSVKKDTAVSVAPRKVHETLKVSRPAMSWDFIKYNGYLKNPGSKKMISFLTINGKSVSLSEGESAENVRLLKNLRDSVKISFNGIVKYIPLHSGAL